MCLDTTNTLEPPCHIRGVFCVKNAVQYGAYTMEPNCACPQDESAAVLAVTTHKEDNRTVSPSRNTPPLREPTALPAPTISPLSGTGPLSLPKPARTLAYLGSVSHSTNDRLFGEFKRLLEKQASDPITLTVGSPGGPTGVAMCFYDTMRFVLRPRLTTLGMGDVDSSGVIIFLSGNLRYVSEHTTVLLHCAGRRFSDDNRFTAHELESMAREDRLKDEQYARLVASHTRRLSARDVLLMMEKETVLSPDDVVEIGIAHGLLR